MWLPLALADLKTAILAPWMKPEAFKSLKTSATLAGWCLPMLSRAIAADEAERDALAFYNSIKTLAEKQAR